MARIQTEYGFNTRIPKLTEEEKVLIAKRVQEYRNEEFLIPETRLTNGDIEDFITSKERELEKALLYSEREDIWFSDLETCIYRTLDWVKNNSSKSND